MNIFYLDYDIELAAQYHCDKHVVKQILEYAQLLSTAHRILDGKPVPIVNRLVKKYRNNEEVVYKRPRKNVYALLDSYDEYDEQTCTLYAGMYMATHKNHPCAVWARASSENYKHLHQLLMHLHNTYTFRYKRTHANYELSKNVLSRIPNSIKLSNHYDYPPSCMKDEFKVSSDVVDNYRNYYIHGKTRMLKWKNLEVPYWIKAAAK